MSDYPKPLDEALQLQNISTETAIIIATKREKINMAVIQVCMIISFILTFWPDL